MVGQGTMSDEDRLADLLLRWEELSERGHEVSPEELCPDCPGHREELARRIHALKSNGLAEEVVRAD